MKFNAKRLDRLVTLSVFAVIAAGITCFFVGLITGGGRENRLVPGALLLALAAVVFAAAYAQLRTGKTPVGESYWNRRFRWVDKDERPFLFWFRTVTWIVASLLLFVFSTLIFVFSTSILD